MHFTITSPKPREIASIAFRDRVYQRSLNDNCVYPLMTKSFVIDNCACQKGKGTDYARRKLEKFLHEHYRKNGCAGYVAQFDIHGYYPSMQHNLIESNFAEKIPIEQMKMVKAILREQYPSDKGYNPGSQMIQIAGISALDKLDHYIKEKLRAHLYLRYMDDFIIISNNREYLEFCKEKITDELLKIGFELNGKKSRIFSLSDGIDFLGFRYSITNTGKVLKQIRPSNVKRERLKLRRLVGKSKRGLMPREKVDESYAAWKNHASYGNSHNLIRRMDKYYESLWEKAND